MKQKTCFPFVNGDMPDWVRPSLTDEEIERVYNGEEVTSGGYYGCPIVWKPNGEFEMTLTYNGFGRGQSSTKFYWLDQYGHQYPMFVVDFDEMFRKGGTTTTHGVFAYQKRGQNFGIKLLYIIGESDDVTDNEEWETKACIDMGR